MKCRLRLHLNFREKDLKGHVSLGEAVESPEDMQEVDYNISPDMKDKERLRFPEVFAKPSREDMKYNQEPADNKDDGDHPVVEVKEPEQDMDDVYHKWGDELQRYLVPLMADKAAAEVYIHHSEPEKDEDELYHPDDQPSPVQESLGLKVGGEIVVRVHLMPEEDMDDLYHKDAPQPLPRQGDVVVPVDLPFQGRHSEPEEDLDHLYHP